MYLQIDPSNISFLKFLLEAHDNLAYLTTISPQSAVIKLVFAPEQEREVREFLESVRDEIGFLEIMMGRNDVCNCSKRSGDEVYRGRSFRDGVS
ncbi:hypothetical protein JCM31598_11990 [Desulfonatronum parangueonense]